LLYQVLNCGVIIVGQHLAGGQVKVVHPDYLLEARFAVLVLVEILVGENERFGCAPFGGSPLRVECLHIFIARQCLLG
jgi:hypothetical protein